MLHDLYSDVDCDEYCRDAPAHLLWTLFKSCETYENDKCAHFSDLVIYLNLCESVTRFGSLELSI